MATNNFKTTTTVKYAKNNLPKEKTNIFQDLYRGFIGSLTNDPTGFSSKKIIAYCVTLCVLGIHYKWMRGSDTKDILTLLGVDFGFIGVLVGINVADKKLNPSADPAAAVAEKPVVETPTEEAPQE